HLVALADQRFPNEHRHCKSSLQFAHSTPDDGDYIRGSLGMNQDPGTKQWAPVTIPQDARPGESGEPRQTHHLCCFCPVSPADENRKGSAHCRCFSWPDRYSRCVLPARAATQSHHGKARMLPCIEQSLFPIVLPESRKWTASSTRGKSCAARRLL